MMKLIDEAKENAFQTIENEAIYLLSNFKMTEEGNQSTTGFGLDIADYKVQLLEFGKALEAVENDVENFNEHDRERVDAFRALARLATASRRFATTSRARNRTFLILKTTRIISTTTSTISRKRSKTRLSKRSDKRRKTRRRRDEPRRRRGSEQ